MKFSFQKQRGFSLMELIIVIAIIGVLSALGYPSYKSHIAKGTRAEAQQAIMVAAQRQQQYFLDARAYADSFGAAGLNLAKSAGFESFDCNAGATECVNKHFTLQIEADNTVAPPTYIIRAVPVATGNNPDDNTFTINHLQTKTGW